MRNLTSHFSATKKVTEKVTIRLSDELWLVEGWWWDTSPFLVAFFFFLVTQDFSKLNTLYRICLTCYMCIFRPKIIVYCMWRRITTSFFFFLYVVHFEDIGDFHHDVAFFICRQGRSYLCM